jgi:hypothetical protein
MVVAETGEYVTAVSTSVRYKNQTSREKVLDPGELANALANPKRNV